MNTLKTLARCSTKGAVHLSTVSAQLETLRTSILFDTPRRLELAEKAALLWKSRRLAKEYALLTKRHDTFHRIETETSDLLELQQFENNTNTEKSWIKEQLQQHEKELETMVHSILFTDTLDHNNCYIELSAGAGGDDAMDFTQMLTEMYIHWGSKGEQFKVTLDDCRPGDIAGYRKARLYVAGDQSYGWLKHETGIHRLIRNSPFNKTNTRETSFARVECIPQVDEEEEKENQTMLLAPNDVEIQTYKSGGAGGQHANKTDSAVRMVHKTTGITVTSSKERSQHANRRICRNILLGKLKNRAITATLAEKQMKYDNYEDNAFGFHFRSYHLITGVTKDKKSSYVSTNASKVLQGDELQQVLLKNVIGGAY